MFQIPDRGPLPGDHDVIDRHRAEAPELWHAIDRLTDKVRRSPRTATYIDLIDSLRPPDVAFDTVTAGPIDVTIIRTPANEPPPGSAAAQWAELHRQLAELWQPLRERVDAFLERVNEALAGRRPPQGGPMT